MIAMKDRVINFLTYVHGSDFIKPEMCMESRLINFLR